LRELHDEAPSTQSDLERRFVEFVRTHGLPEPRTNVLIDAILVDCFWPEHNLVAELDSYGFHTDRRSFESDRCKGITHVRAGRHSIHITQRMITRGPRALRADLSALLARAEG
jgi:very-short-patch-repair endonuclease